MSSLLILGAGGHAKVVAETALSSGAASSLAFLDDSCVGADPPSSLLDWPVMGPLSMSLQQDLVSRFDAAAVAIGHADTRLHWIKQLQFAGYHLPVLIHPTAWVSPTSTLGPACVVFAQALVQTSAFIGVGVILNSGCSVDHDVQLSDGVHICPGARLAGEVRVGSRSWIGMGASLIQRVRIGSDVTIGAGAAVVSNIPDGITAVGVPARAVSSI